MSSYESSPRQRAERRSGGPWPLRVWLPCVRGISTTRQNGGGRMDACHAAVTPCAAQLQSFDGGGGDGGGVGLEVGVCSGASDDDAGVTSGGVSGCSTVVAGCGSGSGGDDADDGDDALASYVVRCDEDGCGAGGISSSGCVSLAAWAYSHGSASSSNISACGANCSCGGIGASNFSSWSSMLYHRAIAIRRC